jgi:hypothetical protein
VDKVNGIKPEDAEDEVKVEITVDNGLDVDVDAMLELFDVFERNCDNDDEDCDTAVELKGLLELICVLEDTLRDEEATGSGWVELKLDGDAVGDCVSNGDGDLNCSCNEETKDTFNDDRKNSKERDEEKSGLIDNVTGIDIADVKEDAPADILGEEVSLETVDTGGIDEAN